MLDLYVNIDKWCPMDRDDVIAKTNKQAESGPAEWIKMLSK